MLESLYEVVRCFFQLGFIIALGYTSGKLFYEAWLV